MRPAVYRRMPHGPRVLRPGAGCRSVAAEKRRAKAKGKEGHPAVTPAREPPERASGAFCARGESGGIRFRRRPCENATAAGRQAATQQTRQTGGKQAGRAPGPSPRDKGARAARVHGRGHRTGWGRDKPQTREAGRRPPEQTHSGTGRQTRRASPGRSMWAGGVKKQFSAQRSPAALTGTQYPAGRRRAAGGRPEDGAARPEEPPANAEGGWRAGANQLDAIFLRMIYSQQKQTQNTPDPR